MTHGHSWIQLISTCASPITEAVEKPFGRWDFGSRDVCLTVTHFPVTHTHMSVLNFKIIRQCELRVFLKEKARDGWGQTMCICPTTFVVFYMELDAYWIHTNIFGVEFTSTLLYLGRLSKAIVDMQIEISKTFICDWFSTNCEMPCTSVTKALCLKVGEQWHIVQGHSQSSFMFPLFQPSVDYINCRFS